MAMEVNSAARAAFNALRAQKKTLALAESCTGGLAAARLTALPGISEVFLGGVCAYTPRAKTELLGVGADLIEQHGVVSAEVALVMARGVQARFHADFGAGVTGYAGPSADSSAPAGTVYMAVCGASGAPRVERIFFQGDRETVRAHAADTLLDMVARAAESK